MMGTLVVKGLITITAANLSYRNPVEQVNSIANIRLQSIGLMRKPISENMEEIMRNDNSNSEIRKLCEKNSKLETELTKSLDQPKKLMEKVFKELSLKEKKIEIVQPTVQEKIDFHDNVSFPNFEDNFLLSLNLRSNFTKPKCPKFRQFNSKHCVSKIKKILLDICNTYM